MGVVDCSCTMDSSRSYFVTPGPTGPPRVIVTNLCFLLFPFVLPSPAAASVAQTVGVIPNDPIHNGNLWSRAQQGKQMPTP